VAGVSLGGHVAALVASLTDGLAAVVAGVPTCDVATMLAATMRSRWGVQAVTDSHVFDDAPRALSRIVSPLAFAPKVRHDRRFIYAAVGDRLVTAGQAVDLWEHWERPEICWLQGAHILNNVGAGRRFVAASLATAGVTGNT
jgi:dienelactone hydrolase